MVGGTAPCPYFWGRFLAQKNSNNHRRALSSALCCGTRAVYHVFLVFFLTEWMLIACNPMACMAHSRLPPLPHPLTAPPSPLQSDARLQATAATVAVGSTAEPFQPEPHSLRQIAEAHKAQVPSNDDIFYLFWDFQALRHPRTRSAPHHARRAR